MGPELPKFKNIILERDGPLTWLLLNRPERLNAMSDLLQKEMFQALDVLIGDVETRVIAIAGEGRAFSTGYDIQRDEAEVGGAHSRDITDDYLRLKNNIDNFMKFWDCPKPVIAAVHGYCLAGATQLCTLCDITVVANDAIIGLPSIPIGGGYITPMWVPFVGPKRAKQMSFQSGSKIDAKTAVDWGWANYSVPAKDLRSHVRELAANIARTPAEILTIKKMAINRVVDVQGFRSIMSLGSEMDAMLHYSGVVQKLVGLIQENGLKNAIEKFQSGEWEKD